MLRQEIMICLKINCIESGTICRLLTGLKSMSFLLDALGKADDDRRRAMVPELRASRYQRRSPGRRALSIVLLICAILLSFVQGYLARPYIEQRLSGEVSASSSSAEVSPPDVERPVEPQTAAVEPGRLPDKVVAAPVMPAVQPEPALAADPIELSVISYAKQPAARFVMLDGVVMYEGDMLDEEVRLVQIKPDGVILERNGQEFSINLGSPR